MGATWTSTRHSVTGSWGCVSTGPQWAIGPQHGFTPEEVTDLDATETLIALIENAGLYKPYNNRHGWSGWTNRTAPEGDLGQSLPGNAARRLDFTNRHFRSGAVNFWFKEYQTERGYRGRGKARFKKPSRNLFLQH